MRRPSGFLAEALGEPLVGTPAAALAVGTRAATGGSAFRRSPDRGPRSPVGAPLELSFTQVDDYLTCPRKYHLRHVARVPTAPHHALVLGNALHQAVAVANLARLRGQPVEVRSALETLEAHWSSEGFLSAEHEAARFASGQAALRRYVERLEDDDGARHRRRGAAVLGAPRSRPHPRSLRRGAHRAWPDDHHGLQVRGHA